MNRSNENEQDDGSPVGSKVRWTSVVRHRYDPDGNEELTTAIVFAIAEAADVTPHEMTSPPLYEYVDVTAVEDIIFGSEAADASRGRVRSVKFRYTDYLVAVGDDGWIRVYESADPTA